MARQCIDECVVAVQCRRDVAHSVGDLVNLAPHLAGGLEHYEVELNVEALDRCAHARRAGSDHDQIVECFVAHESTLRPILRTSRLSWDEIVGGRGPSSSHTFESYRAQ